jgi:GTP:adenosylcobinamide-phosphate guanylyltransferase
MTTSVPTTAMILAAGMGKRMRPLTDTVPKPMVPLAGKPLIGHVVDRFVAAGVTRIVVNLHYRGEQIRAYLDAEDRAEIVFSEESDLLETGGGIQNAMPELGTQPFYVANADAFWLNGFEDTLHRLADAWDDEPFTAMGIPGSAILSQTPWVGLIAVPKARPRPGCLPGCKFCTHGFLPMPRTVHFRSTCCLIRRSPMSAFTESFMTANGFISVRLRVWRTRKNL